VLTYCVLGPLEVRRDGALVPITSSRRRTVLAALAVRANQVVGVDALIGYLWGEAVPSSARVTLQNYVRRLRAALVETRAAESARAAGRQIDLTEPAAVSPFAHLAADRLGSDAL
jgi:DNA-binding SARP family transcriptional activator